MYSYCYLIKIQVSLLTLISPLPFDWTSVQHLARALVLSGRPCPLTFFTFARFAPKTPRERNQLLHSPSTSLIIQVHLFAINPHVESVPDPASTDLNGSWTLTLSNSKWARNHVSYIYNHMHAINGFSSVLLLSRTYPNPAKSNKSICSKLSLHLLPVSSFPDVIFPKHKV